MDPLFRSLWRLSPDNFTPPSRTPWGGTKIIDRYKRTLALGTTPACVGEAWEVSVEPNFPSRLVDHGGITLAEAIARDPVAALGERVAKKFGGLPILVKWLDAREALSVQVHPKDDYARLTAKQCGKPESWIILEADAGAGLYLGFKDGVTKEDVAHALQTNAALDALMTFVPVHAGDTFEIEAGTAHAIGGGITLIEPQLVQPGREGVTYRFWDWNRRYDKDGQPSPSGSPRALHVDESLEVTRFDLLGDAFVKSTRRSGKVMQTNVGARWVRHIDNPSYRADTIGGTGTLAFVADTGIAITVARGSVVTKYGAISAGESAFVPAVLAAELALTLTDVYAVVSAPRA
ncbi:MAG: class I mannose-6-phosphate isomerase [Deltaproteobacteria bacterium]|nr:class I mannose-6-phosphate isomerase [Deltaproteobacteria bacterium]